MGIWIAFGPDASIIRRTSGLLSSASSNTRATRDQYSAGSPRRRIKYAWRGRMSKRKACALPTNVIHLSSDACLALALRPELTGRGRERSREFPPSSCSAFRALAPLLPRLNPLRRKGSTRTKGSSRGWCRCNAHPRRRRGDAARD